MGGVAYSKPIKIMGGVRVCVSAQIYENITPNISCTRC